MRKFATYRFLGQKSGVLCYDDPRANGMRVFRLREIAQRPHRGRSRSGVPQRRDMPRKRAPVRRDSLDE